MEVKILEERANPLLKRVEYRFEVEHATASTPTRDAVRTEVAKAVRVPKDRVIIERMQSRFGVARSRGDAAAYQSADALKAVVREHILVRNGLKEKAVKGAAPAAPEPPKAEPAPAPAPPKKESAAAPEAPKKEGGSGGGKKERPAAEPPKKEG